jgi:hypothetical protein
MMFLSVVIGNPEIADAINNTLTLNGGKTLPAACAS